LPTNSHHISFKSRHFYPESKSNGYLFGKGLQSKQVRRNLSQPSQSTQIFVQSSSNQIPVSVEIHTPFKSQSLKSGQVSSSRKKLRSDITSSNTSSIVTPVEKEKMTVFTVFGAEHHQSANSSSMHFTSMKGLHSGSDPLSIHSQNYHQSNHLNNNQTSTSYTLLPNGHVPSVAVNELIHPPPNALKESHSVANLETIVEELSPSALSNRSPSASSLFANNKESQANSVSNPSFTFSFPPGVLNPGSATNMFDFTEMANNKARSTSGSQEGINQSKNTKVVGKNLLFPTAIGIDNLEEIQSISSSMDLRLNPSQGHSGVGRLELEPPPPNTARTGRRKSSILSMDKLFHPQHRSRIGSVSDGMPNSRQSIISRLSFSHPEDNELRVTNFNRLTDLRRILNPEEEKEDLWATFWAKFNSCDWFEWNLNNAAKIITIIVFVVTLILIIQALINAGI